MNIYKIVFSPTGGTKKVVDLVANIWETKEQIKEIDLTNPKEDFALYEFEKEDICYVAVPSFYGRVPTTASERLSKLKGHGAQAVLLGVYGNREFEDTLVELEDVLQKAGFCCRAAVAAVAEHSVAHRFGAGRPDAEDQKELTAFGEHIYQKLTAEKPENGKEEKLVLPGNRPYKAYGSMPAVPVGGEDCTECGLCAKVCPVQAIDPKNPCQTDVEKCILCMKCTAVCPVKSRSLPKEFLAGLEQKLEKVCSERKENTLFLF